MIRYTRYFIALLLIALFTGCSNTEGPTADQVTSLNTALFDPSASVIPLPNILATATANDPLTKYMVDPGGNAVARPANTPMTPPEALSYVNKYEMGETNAVAGINAPIYIRVATPVTPSTVSAATIKVFQITPDASGLTENNPLGFTDVSAMFTYQYKAGSTDILLFPNFPLTPGSRYVYVVTNRVKDAASGGSLAGSFFFEALKATTPLLGSFAALEPIRANKLSGTNILLSGYAKVMDDLIAASATTTITSRSEIALLGRFITTGAGFIQTDATNSATRIPMEAALRSFAAGPPLGGLPGKTWTNAVTGATTIPGAAYWAGAGLPAAAYPASLVSVVLGSINSAELSIDPVVAKANATTIDLTAVTGAYNPAAGVVQAFRSGVNLTGFYHATRSVPFVYLVPATPNGKLIIFQHGITGQKEQVLAVAGALTGAGFAVVAIDLPLHGALAVTAHQGTASAVIPGSVPASTYSQAWGQDFMAIGAPLATRSNIQQAAFNLNRLELTLRTGGFALAGIAPAPPTDIKFAGISLGSIVGTYYLAGNTTLVPATPPYTQASLDTNMKGFLSVPGARTAYLIQNSPAFGPSVDAGLAAKGIVKNSPTYHQFFQVTQSVVDPADPASVTTPLAPGLPSRLSGRLAIQEATSTTFTADGITPTNGDLVITNAYTRYLANALGGRGVLGTAAALAVAPGFKQLGYAGAAAPRIPANFMYTLLAGAATPKVDFAATSTEATTPTEGYFQFDQSGVSHGFLLSPTDSPTATQLGQRQMLNFFTTGLVVDPTTTSALRPKGVAAGLPALDREILLPPVLDILGH